MPFYVLVFTLRSKVDLIGHALFDSLQLNPYNLVKLPKD